MKFFLCSFLLFCVGATAFPQSVVPDCSYDGWFANKQDPRKYYACHFGELIPHECEQGKLWSQTKLQCDFDYNVVPVTFSTTASSIPGGPDCSYNGLFAYPGDTSKYIVCHFGELRVNQCQENHVWNQEKQTCEYSSPSTPLPYGSDCSSNGNIAYPGNESKYIFCYGGQAFINDCPTGKVWNQQKDSCV